MYALYFIVTWGYLVLLIGWWGLRSLMASNECSMTYSMPSMNPIHVESSITGYSLLIQWSDANGRETANKKELRSKPVLFIPGHLGR